MRVEPLTFWENVLVLSFFICCFSLGFIVRELRYDENEHLVIIFLGFTLLFSLGYIVRGQI